MKTWPVSVRALLAQAGAGGVVAIALKAGWLDAANAGPWGLAGIDSALALAFAWLLRLPDWWLPIQGLFVPVLLLSFSADVPPGVWLGGFVLLWLLFRSNTRERVPLYLSNCTTWDAVAALAPRDKPFKLVDLGCGIGGGLAYLGDRYPRGEFHGVESAPLPWLLGWLRLRGKPHCRIRCHNLWDENLGAYDLVYAFLSPEPMPALWAKALREMRPGSLLVSNSFEVPGIKPDRIVEVGDGRQTRLLVWQMGVEHPRCAASGPFRLGRSNGLPSRSMAREPRRDSLLYPGLPSIRPESAEGHLSGHPPATGGSGKGRRNSVPKSYPSILKRVQGATGAME